MSSTYPELRAPASRRIIRFFQALSSGAESATSGSQFEFREKRMKQGEPKTADTHQIVLVLDDDPMITEGLAMGLAREGRTVITANDLEGGEMVVEWLKPSHVVSDVRLTGTFGYEGLDFIRFVKRH